MCARRFCDNLVLFEALLSSFMIGDLVRILCAYDSGDLDLQSLELGEEDELNVGLDIADQLNEKKIYPDWNFLHSLNLMVMMAFLDKLADASGETEAEDKKLNLYVDALAAYVKQSNNPDFYAYWGQPMAYMARQKYCISDRIASMIDWASALLDASSPAGGLIPSDCLMDLLANSISFIEAGVDEIEGFLDLFEASLSEEENPESMAARQILQKLGTEYNSRCFEHDKEALGRLTAMLVELYGRQGELFSLMSYPELYDEDEDYPIDDESSDGWDRVPDVLQGCCFRFAVRQTLKAKREQEK